MADITQFKAQMLTGGARPNQFKCIIAFPGIVSGGGIAGPKMEFLARSASLPESILADVAVPYRGRVVHFAGEREFQPWNIEVYTDNDFVVRSAMEDWVNKIQNAATTNGILEPLAYQTDIQVYQLDRNDVIVKEYNFKDAYPLTVGAIQLSWDAANQIETYPVTFQYNYWEPV